MLFVRHLSGKEGQLSINTDFSVTFGSIDEVSVPIFSSPASVRPIKFEDVKVHPLHIARAMHYVQHGTAELSRARGVLCVVNATNRRIACVPALEGVNHRFRVNVWKGIVMEGEQMGEELDA